MQNKHLFFSELLNILVDKTKIWWSGRVAELQTQMKIQTSLDWEARRCLCHLPLCSNCEHPVQEATKLLMSSLRYNDFLFL